MSKSWDWKLAVEAIERALDDAQSAGAPQSRLGKMAAEAATVLLGLALVAAHQAKIAAEDE